MISVLIPIYNVDIRELVNELLKQALQIDQPIEIICIDDCSTSTSIKSFNRAALKKLNLVQYTELSENIGRGAIRMLLAEKSAYDTLIFLDCDMRIPNSDYLEKFVQHSEKKVVIGGITYSTEPPTDPNLLLRWKYGVSREKISATERNKMRFSHFVASNLLISKKIFLSLPVDDDIVGYGHEDTLLGLKLLKMKIPLSHIDNPLEHLGLDNARTFLEKSRSGTSNLAKLYAKKICGKEIRLINVFEQLNYLGLASLARQTIAPLMGVIEKNLTGNDPKIILFDIWKLYYFMLDYSAVKKSSS